MTLALAEFAPKLHPGLLSDINGWATHRGLRPLHLGLQGAVPESVFYDRLAEAMVARHLERKGCGLVVEVPTPSGRACDFEVTHAGHTFYLHVKRLETERPARRNLSISPRLRMLERIERPYIVQVRWRKGTTEVDMQRFVNEAGRFIRSARVGEEHVVKAESGREIGGVLMTAPHDGTHVTLAIGLPSGFIDETQRMRRLLRRAYRQFMPRALNVTLLCSSHRDDRDDFDNALFGAHVERWDAFPPKGRRVAHGRAGDGLWHGKRYGECRAAGWFPFQPEEDALDLYFCVRDEASLTEADRETLAAVFGATFG